MCKEIIPIFLCVALLLSFTLPEIGDYTIREFIYGVQDTTAVVRGTRIACEIIAVSNPGYVVYTIYDTDHSCHIKAIELIQPIVWGLYHTTSRH